MKGLVKVANTEGKLRYKPDKRHTVPLDDCICPKCGILGQRKYRKGNSPSKTGRKYYDTYYEYVDHYYKSNGMNRFHGKFKNSCYIGKVK